MKRISVAAALAAMLLALSGCDDESSAEAKAYDCQVALNDGNYQKVIDSSSCSDMDRAAAHAGKAGFTAMGILDGLIADEDSESTTFVSRLVQGEPSAQKNADLNMSKSLYGDLIGSNDFTELNTTCRKGTSEYEALSRNQKDACFIRPIVSSAQVAMGLELVKRDGNSTNVNSDSLADMINSGELDLIALVMGGSDSDAAAAIEDAKKEICEAQTTTHGGDFDDCMAGSVTAAGIDAYMATLD